MVVYKVECTVSIAVFQGILLEKEMATHSTLSGWTTVHLFIHLLLAILTVSKFWQLRICAHVFLWT